MYTSIAILALAGSMLAPSSPSPRPNLVWWRDYYVAKERGVKEQKPLAVFVGTGQGGYHQITQKGELNDSIKEVLADHYVCVYLDTSSQSQNGLITALAVTKGNGLVLSDRTGNVQAFHHDGQITEADLARQLQHFAERNVEIRTTLTNTTQRFSYYPTGSSNLRPAANAPAVYAPARSSRNC
jgi:hypothetical protein